MLSMALLFFCVPCFGDIVRTGGGTLYVGQPPVLLHRAAMYSASDAPSASSPGNGNPFIEISAIFASSLKTGQMDPLVGPIVPNEQATVGGKENPLVTGRVQVFVISGPDYDVLGECDEVKGERIVLRGGSRYTSWSANVDFLNTSSVELSGPSTHYEIEWTDIHWLLLSNCDPRLGNVTYAPTTSRWMNPFGYLPGSLYSFLVFYKWLSILFGVLWLVWLFSLLVYWKEVIELQHWAAGLIFLNLVEAFVWYLDYMNLNKVGVRHTTVLVLAMLLTVARRAISRVLITAICMGYGVIKPSLGRDGQWLTVLGELYFVFEAALELLLKYSQTHVVSTVLKSILIIPPSFCEAIFYSWIFLSLARIIQSLRARKQTVKLELYWKFTRVLLVSLLVALGLTFYQIHYFSQDMDVYNWKELWAVEVGYNEGVAVGILCSILWLWRPSINSQRYAYAAVPTDVVELTPDSNSTEDDHPVRTEPVRIDLADQTQVVTTKKSKARFALEGDADDEDDLQEDADAAQTSSISSPMLPAIFGGSDDIIPPNGSHKLG
eukprot:gb/GEZN01005804.1/.p1 GENE.gb/GEZN01005804.1/~~gb/GEZN01005804.1/.p1  ORF type:complete len:549 (+),score=48.93 gb/GEZN01005804.1/:73-1719(+)